MSKYNVDLDYVIPGIDISSEELEEIKVEADRIISENRESNENLAVAYLKKAQILQKTNGAHTCGLISYDEPDGWWLLPKEKKEIKKSLEKALELSPNMPEALMRLELLKIPGLFGGKKNKDKASNFFSKAIQLKPDYAAAFNNRAMLFYDSNNMLSVDEETKKELEKNKSNFKNAIADLTEAIRIRPFDTLYHLNRGIFHSRLEEHKEAVEDFTSAINYASDALKERLKTEVKIFNLRGNEYMELKEYGKAIDDFSESLRLMAEYINDTLLLRGKAYYLADEKDKAKADIEEYLDRTRKNAEAAGRKKILKIFGAMPDDIFHPIDP